MPDLIFQRIMLNIQNLIFKKDKIWFILLELSPDIWIEKNYYSKFSRDLKHGIKSLIFSKKLLLQKPKHKPTCLYYLEIELEIIYLYLIKLEEI